MDVREADLKKSLEEINWSIIGFCERRRAGSISLHSENDLHYSSNSTKNVVFIVKKNLVVFVTDFRGISKRIA